MGRSRTLQKIWDAWSGSKITNGTMPCVQHKKRQKAVVTSLKGIKQHIIKKKHIKPILFKN